VSDFCTFFWDHTVPTPMRAIKLPKWINQNLCFKRIVDLLPNLSVRFLYFFWAHSPCPYERAIKLLKYSLLLGVKPRTSSVTEALVTIRLISPFMEFFLLHYYWIISSMDNAHYYKIKNANFNGILNLSFGEFSSSHIDFFYETQNICRFLVYMNTHLTLWSVHAHTHYLYKHL
jgi:hypothetical protein